MSKYIIAIVVLLVVLIVITCEVYRKERYAPSDESNRQKQLLDIAYATTGNRIDTYTNISELLPPLLRDIDSAKEYVLFQFFKFENDYVGVSVQQALIKKALENVPVYVLYDAFPGSVVSHSFFREMELYGVKVHRYNAVFPFPSAYSNNRNHRKIVVIDGTIGYVGGMNIAKRYLTGVHGGAWRDTHLRIEGAACYELQQVFAEDWRKVSRLPLAVENSLAQVAVEDRTAIQIIASDPEDITPPILQAMLQMAEKAERYLYVQSPYFLPPTVLQDALCQAAARGVDVQLMLPQRGDRSILMSYASRSYLKPLLEAGVKVHLHTVGFIHAKMWVADDNIATVGSSNIDFRSFFQSSEVNAFVYDSRFAQEMREIFERDKQYCQAVAQDWWLHRSLKERALQLRVKPFRTLL